MSELDKAIKRAVDAAMELSEAKAAIQRVRDLHKPMENGQCHGCDVSCDFPAEWPCDTIRALDGE